MDGEYYLFQTGSINHLEFEGFMSGDGEAFCWAVDRDTYARLEGEEPSLGPDGAPFTDMFFEDHFSFYGSDFGFSKNGISARVKIEVDRTPDGIVHSKRTYLDNSKTKYCIACGYTSKPGSVVCSSCGVKFGS